MLEAPRGDGPRGQAWLAHADARTTTRYSHHRPQIEDAAKLARGSTPTTDRDGGEKVAKSMTGLPGV